MSWDYNCPKFVDFTNIDVNCSQGSEEYFDVDHELPNSTESFVSQTISSLTGEMEQPCSEDQKLLATTNEMALQAPVNLREVLMSQASGSSRKRKGVEEKRRSSQALRSSARLQRRLEEVEEGAAKKAKKGATAPCISPLILNKSPTLLRRERKSRDHSLSVPRKDLRSEGRKRHASESRTVPGSKTDKTKSKKPTLTQVQPFHFATDSRIKGLCLDAKDSQKRKRQIKEPTKFISLAEQIEAFHTQVPDRFKSQSNHTKPLPHFSPKLTRPKTPRLRTNLRSRPPCVKSQQDREQEELAEIQNYKFHAKPFDPRIMVHTIGIPMVKTKSVTKPVDIQLATDKRAVAWKKTDQVEEVFHFKANPAPKMGPMRAKPIASIPNTEPKSPAFSLKLRSAAWQKHQEELAAKEVAKKTPVRRQQSMPPPQSPYQKHPTVPVPFSFAEADKKRFAKKEAKIKEILESENKVHLFHANPMPSPSPALLPQKLNISCTRSEPFQLLIDQRGQKRSQQWKEQVEEEMLKIKEATKFRARAASVLTKEPFKPEKVAKPLTETTNLVLNTEKRASERERYDEMRRQHEAEMERVKAMKDAEQEERERELVLELRTKAVHKAQPVPRFDNPPSIKPSEKPLTLAKSPRFSERLMRSTH